MRALAALGDHRAAALIDAVKTERQALPTDARDWADRIEALRSRLLADDRPLETVEAEFTGVPEDRDVLRLPVREVCEASNSPRDGLLLFQLLRGLKPTNCLELGTCLGVSAAYQAAALELNGAGQLATLEAARARAELAAENLRDLGLSRAQVVQGRFQDTLAGVLATYRPVDYAFIDGHHEELATVEYFRQVAEVASVDATLVLDDIAWSDGMRRAWATVAGDERVAIAVNLGNYGVLFMGDGRPQQSIDLPLD